MPRRLIVSMIVVFVFVFDSPSYSQSGGDYLDLTGITQSGAGLFRGAVAGAGTSSIDPAVAAPFKLELLWIDDRQHFVGGDIVAEMRIENIGLDSVSIPWSGDYDKVRPEGYETVAPPGFELALMSLVVSHKGSGDHVLVGQVIAGSHSCIGSLRLLRPSEVVRVKVRVRLDFMNQEINSSYLARVPMTLEVRAQLAFIDGSIKGALRPIVSSNVMKVHVEKRQ